MKIEKKIDYTKQLRKICWLSRKAYPASYSPFFIYYIMPQHILFVLCHLVVYSSLTHFDSYFCPDLLSHQLIFFFIIFPMLGIY